MGEERVAVDMAERRLYDHDISPMLSVRELVHRTVPDAVVRPRDTGQVSELLRLARMHGFPVIPRGAATWSLGGAVPVTGGVVLDMTSLDRVIAIDGGRSEVTVEAGATWKKAIDAAQKKGLHIGTYPSSFPSATIGGWIGVGGAGVGTCRYGPISDNLNSLQVVLPDGNVIQSAGEGSRYPVGTFVGTEGVFGVITRASIKACPLPAATMPVSYSFEALADAGPFLQRLASDIRPMHVMFADRTNFDWLESAGVHTGVRSAIVTVVLEGEPSGVEADADKTSRLAASSGGKEAPREVGEREWRERSVGFRMRKLGTGSLTAEAILPVSDFRPAVEETYDIIRRLKLTASIIGTIADNNTFMLMPYYLIDERRPFRTLAAMTFNVRLARMAFRRGGRMAGPGMYFSSLREKMHPDAGFEKMLELKKRLDPGNVLNPGKLLEGRYGSGRRMSHLASRFSTGLLGALRSFMGPERLPREDSGRPGKDLGRQEG